MVARAVAGGLVAAGIALAARGAGSLSVSGAVAATAVGAACVAAGWPFGALLILYFVLASALSRLGAASKQRRTGAVVEKGSERDAAQVLANGGVFAALALASLVCPSPVITAAACGALAASSADTWGTELGTLYGGEPRSILSRRPLPVGTSGGVSVVGSVATLAGALAIALPAHALGIVAGVFVVAAAGTFGALTDSLIGARLQARRWCPSCERHTERRIHDCGTATEHVAGMAWMTNDTVNLLATIGGSAAAALLASL